MPGMVNTMREFKQGTLHSGSKKGPIVKSRKQAIAIGLSELHNRSTRGSAPFSAAEIAAGYRCLDDSVVHERKESAAYERNERD